MILFGLEFFQLLCKPWNDVFLLFDNMSQKMDKCMFVRKGREFLAFILLNYAKLNLIISGLENLAGLLVYLF